MGIVEVEAAVRQHPERFTAFACLGTLELSHALPQDVSRVADYIKRGFRGVRLYPQHHSYHPLYQPFLDAILEEAASLGCPVLLPLRIIMNWGMPTLDLNRQWKLSSTDIRASSGCSPESIIFMSCNWPFR